MLPIRSLFVLVTFLVFWSDASCPFQEGELPKSQYEPVRGHHKPFGHHAKQWRRIETVYEHPHPEQFYNNYVRQSRPLVIKGGAADWPAIKKWTNLTYMAEKGGRDRKNVLWKQIYGYDKFHPIRIDMTMKEFTETFEKYPLYMDATVMNGLHDDMYWPPSLGCKFFLKRTKQMAIMMNSGRSKSPLHIDASDTYFIQVTGRRLWLLSPPKTVAHTFSGHPHLVDHTGISILNQTWMDLEKFPDASKLTIYAGYAEPGDIIFVPETWFHQVVTDGSPNIAAPLFLNILYCSYAAKGADDIETNHYCMDKILSRKPKTLECEQFPEKQITIRQLMKKFKMREGAFLEETDDRQIGLRHNRFAKILPDKSKIPTLGMSLAGMSKEALAKGEVLKHGLIEGYRLYCVAPNDGSEEALGKVIRSRPKLRKAFRILFYVPIQKPEEIVRTIDTALQRLNTNYLNFVLLAADYCQPDYDVGACTRNAYNDKWTSAWRALEQLQQQGKIRFLGVSDFSLSELKQLLKIKSVPVSIARARYDLYFRNTELKQFCKKNKIHFMGRSVLGGRWKTEAPNYPGNRDIFQEHVIKKVAYEFKLSIHSTVYDWATKKNVIICPRVNDPLHARVNVKAIDNESVEKIGQIAQIDAIYPDDVEGVYAEGGSASDFSTTTLNVDDSTNGLKKADIDRMAEEDEKRASNLYNVDNKDKKYTDDKDFEVHPSYMDLEEK